MMKSKLLCPVCKSDENISLYESRDRMFLKQGKFILRKCVVCKIVFLDPFLSVKELRLYYPSQMYYAYKGKENEGFLQKVRSYMIMHYYSPTLLSKIISFFVHNVPAMPRQSSRHGKVLDVGCGTGDTLLLLQKTGWDVYGTEMDKKAVLLCQQKGLQHVRLGTFEVIAGYANGVFDAIRLYHVIEHIPDPQYCLKLLYKKLKNGGELIIGTPNVSSIVAKFFGTYWYNLDSPRHLLLFNTKTLRQMAEREGFKMQSVEYCSAGGVAGSLQYWIADRLHRKINLIDALWCILLFYPIEWVLDKIGTGDVFVMRMTK